MKFDLNAIFNIDRRIIFAVVFLTLLIPMLVPYAMPCKPTSDVQTMYDFFDRAARNNKPVFLSFEFDPTGAAEQEPMARAVMRHIFARGGKAVVMCKSGGEQGQDLHLRILAECAQEYGAVYGEDYVYLPYKPGSTNIVINLGQSLHTAWPQDYLGTNLSDIPLTRGLSRLADFEYTMVICSGLVTVIDWLTYAQAPYNLNMGFGVLGNVTPDCANYVNSRQIKGLLGGLIGAAQYEQILNDEGVGLMRRFSPADLVTSRVPALCGVLADERREGLAEFVWGRLGAAEREDVSRCASAGRDNLKAETKLAITNELNAAILPAESAGPATQTEQAGPDAVISDDQLAGLKLPGTIGKLLDHPDIAANRPQILRRLYIENEFEGKLAKCHGDGKAMRWMTPQSVAHVVLIVAILFGNVCYLFERYRARKQRATA